MLRSASSATVDLGVLLGTVIVVTVAAPQVVAGTFSVGALVAYLGYLGKLYGPAKRLSKVNVSIQKIVAAAERIFEVRDLEFEPVEIAQAVRPAPAVNVSPSSPPTVRFEQVTFDYGTGRPALDNLTLEVAPGEAVALVGRSGAGKTTLVNLLLRLYSPTSGRILLDGRDIARMDPVKLRLGIGYVIQQVGLFPHLTVAENVATVPRLLGWEPQRVRGRTRELLDLVGLDPDVHGRRYPSQLSGGQRQRVGVARALGADPPVLLMDEPFGAVDRLARDRLQNEFQGIQRRMKKTVVFVTHDIDEAIKLGDRIALLAIGGVLQQYDTPARILAQPANDFVTEFLGPERAEKVLSVTPINPQNLRRDPESADSLPRLEVTASLGDALALMLLTGSERLAIEQSGRHLGVLSASDIFRSSGRGASMGTSLA
jgi:osmoprotectant transport system ATP-binding protein